jgi:hypothetical protein
MDFSHSPKVVALQERVLAFVREHVQPAEKAFKAEMDAFRAAGNPWQNTRAMEGLKDKAKAAGLWNMFLPESEAGAGPDQPGIRAAVRDHGPLPADGRGHELLGARHRQHGGPGTLRHGRAQGTLAQAAARRAHPLGLCDDRAGGGLVRRHGHRMPHRTPGRPLRHQRPQVVDQRRTRPALRDLHPDGQDRPHGVYLSTAVDDPGAQGHAGREGRTPRCRSSATTTRRTGTPRSASPTCACR